MSNKQDSWGIPIHIDDEEPEIFHPGDPLEERRCHAANEITFKLLRCLEALLDIERLLTVLTEQENPASDRQITKLLATPIYNLAVSVNDLFNELEGNFKEHEHRFKQGEKLALLDGVKEFRESIPLTGSALRKVRDKISSHIDKNAFKPEAREIWSLIDLRTFLLWIRTIGDKLMLLLSLDVYAWTRESGHPDVYRMMSEDGTQVDLLLEQKVVVGVTLAKSPKYFISQKVLSVASLWVKIMDRLNTIER